MASETPYSGRAAATIDQFSNADSDDEDDTCPNGVMVLMAMICPGSSASIPTRNTTGSGQNERREPTRRGYQPRGVP